MLSAVDRNEMEFDQWQIVKKKMISAVKYNAISSIQQRNTMLSAVHSTEIQCFQQQLMKKYNAISCRQQRNTMLSIDSKEKQCYQQQIAKEYNAINRQQRKTMLSAVDSKGIQCFQQQIIKSYTISNFEFKFEHSRATDL